MRTPALPTGYDYNLSYFIYIHVSQTNSIIENGAAGILRSITQLLCNRNLLPIVSSYLDSRPFTINQTVLAGSSYFSSLEVPYYRQFLTNWILQGIFFVRPVHRVRCLAENS